MKPAPLLFVLLLPLAGCGVLNQGKSAPSVAPPRLLSPLSGNRVALPERAPAPLPTPTPKRPTLSAADLDYLRWLIQFDAATRQILAQQARDLPPPRPQQEMTRIRAMLGKWEDAPHEAGILNTKASAATEQALRLQQILSQFQARQAPPACARIAAGYSSVLVGHGNTSQFNMRLYRQFAQLMQNPRGASQMIPEEFQDGGVAADNRLQQELRNARDAANAALVQLFQRFPDEIPADIAAFRVMPP